MKFTFSLNKAQYSNFGFLLTIAAILQLLLGETQSLGIVVFGAFQLAFGFLAGLMLLRHENAGWQVFFGALFLVAVEIVVLSFVYWFAAFSIAAVAVVIALISFAVLAAALRRLPLIHVTISLPSKANWLHVVLAAGYAILFWKLFSRQTGDTLISPWTLFGPKFFVLFAGTTGLLIYTSKEIRYRALNIFFIILHYALSLCVALIVYKHGFGFDPFIHQAAEAVILRDGSITPKQPYYIGQYILTLVGHLITNIPHETIDKLLAPVAASITLPLITYRSMRSRLREEILLPALILLPIIPFSFFTFTTPNNLALVSAAIVFLMLYMENERTNTGFWIIISCLVLLTFAIHPFIGIPVLLIAFGFWMWIKRPTLHTTMVFAAVLTLALPVVLWLNSIRLSQAVAIHNPLQRLQPFLTLFRKPHWFLFDQAPILWQLLYAYRLALIPLILVCAAYGLWQCRKTRQAQFHFVAIIATFFSAFFLSTTIAFPDVIFYEQGVYAGRLLALCVLLLLPFFLHTIASIISVPSSRKWLWISTSLFGAILLTISWYFTYPTRDPVSLHTGYAIRDADIETVHFIHKRAGDDPYIVLTNQTVSSAAIKELGFFRYFDTADGSQFAYAIPTGGPLYEYFRKMVYEEPKRQWMEGAMQFAGVHRAYFVHTNYWAPAAGIRDAAKQEADTWWELAGGRVWVYEYLEASVEKYAE